MSFWVKSSTLAMGYGGVGGASYMVYDTVTPKTIGERLVWEGIVIIEGSSIQAYKAVFEENKANLTDITGIEANTKLDDGYPKLKEWCEKQVLIPYTGEKENVEDLEKVKKRCVDKFETVKGRLIRLSVNAEEILKSNDEDYKVVFALYRNDTTNNFISFIKTIKVESTVSETTKADDGFSDLKDACNGYLAKKAEEVNDSQLKKIYWWCSPPAYKTVSEKLNIDKYEMETETTQFQELFDRWKFTENVMTNLKTEDSSLSDSSDKTTGGTAMKQWCEKQKSKNLSEDKIYPDTYAQVKFVCSKKKAS